MSEHQSTDTDAIPTAESIDFAEQIEAVLKDKRDPESHRELDPRVFHPSQIGYCKRQAYIKKLGLGDTDDLLGTFHTGTMIHTFMEEEVGPRLPDHVQLETPVEYEQEGIRFIGHADCYDPLHDDGAGAVYDFKSRGGWYNHNPPTERHMAQLSIYMAATGAEYGQIVYISKKDMEVRPYPEDGATFELDAATVDRLVQKAAEIRDAIFADGIATEPEEIPFDKCGCWMCDNESLSFPQLGSIV